MKKSKTKRICGVVIPLILILFAIVSAIFLGEKSYSFFTVLVVILACLPLLFSFELKNENAQKIVLLAVLTALSVLGRVVFAYIPFFKPVTAIVIIVGLYLGYEYGFVCGVLSALLSNFVFGQGPWTPFQMLSWGLIGLFCGLLANPLRKNIFLLLIVGFLSGIFFSVVMDLWNAVWLDGEFILERFLTLIISALPVTIIYGVSNVVFLLILAKPLGKKIARIQLKYGL